MRLKINRYTVFYSLYIYFLFLTLFPSLSPVFGGGPVIFALSLILLFYSLPVIFIIILIVDIYNKRFKIAIKNISIVVILFFLTWSLKKYILDTYVYIKPDTSGQIEAAPPMKTLDE